MAPLPCQPCEYRDQVDVREVVLLDVHDPDHVSQVLPSLAKILLDLDVVGHDIVLFDVVECFD